jgi:hypothetical protein
MGSPWHHVPRRILPSGVAPFVLLPMLSRRLRVGTALSLIRRLAFFWR